MICEPCSGLGRIPCAPRPATVNGITGMVTWSVCRECGGNGIVSCCEGIERDAGVAGVDAPPKGATS
jgi:hypothetical protein